MDEKVNPELPENLLSGRLEGISVPDLLWALCSKERTGVLHLADPSGIGKKVYVEKGQIIFAASSDPNDRLGEMLLRQGTISLDQLDHAISLLPSGKRLGTILVEKGYLSPENLVRGVVAQVRGIVLGLFAWTEGEYRFIEGPLPTAEVVTLNMRTPEILFQGIRQIRAFTRIRRSVGPSRTLYRVVGNAEERLRGLTLVDGERALLDAIGTGGRTVGDLCLELFLSNFEIYQALWAFRVLGVIEEAEHPSEVAGAMVVEGRFDADGLAGLMLRLARAGETGVLHVSRRSQERAFQFREGRCVFATSNDIDDGLLAYLLRRGVVSLRDREETAKRLLSNKRVGKILLEMGIIDQADLDRTVREQLLEIVCDTFRWQEADWAFHAGELPTIEDITLDASVEDLVATGIRRIDSWSRVREGCGGLEARLCLTPSYLAVLDRMQAGDAEWEIVARLRTPSTIMEICRGTAAGDFRVCQSLWTLRLLGAVAAAPIEARIEPETMDIPAASPEPEPALEIAAAPEPIAPATIPEGQQYELTGADEMTPDPIDAGDTARERIEPSNWTEPAEEPVAAWTPAADTPRLELAPAPAAANELITEPWRLAADRPAEPAAAVASVEAVETVETVETVADATASPLDALAGDRTVPIPPEVLAAALASSTATPEVAEAPRVEEAPAAVEPEWIAPADLDPSIVRFNARHKVVWRVIRSEVGAGAANFVRSCRNALGEGYQHLLEGTELQPDGTFEPAAVRRSVAAHRIDDPASGLERLLEQELGQLSLYLGEKRAQALREQVAAI